MILMQHTQRDYDIRLEWGGYGIDCLGPDADVLVLIDTLSFTTCVDVVVSHGATVFPFVWRDQRAQQYAAQKQALLAVSRSMSSDGYSLSPASLINIPVNTRLVLPSPNGSTLTMQASQYCPVVAASLRNVGAVAQWLQRHYRRISIIPSGERWPDNSLRPAIEDWLVAGALVQQLTGKKSTEAHLAEISFSHCRDVAMAIRHCSSGVELIEAGYAQDVEIASAMNVSRCVPILQQDCFVHAG